MARKRKGGRKGGLWIQSATAKMRQKGTLGKFGAATPGKIARAKKKGGLQAKRAQFALNMKRIAAKRKHRGRSSSRS
jgi:hypothetical protein